MGDLTVPHFYLNVMDMSIEEITGEEFYSLPVPRRGSRTPRLSPESKAVVDLGEGHGLKFPCRWSHSKKSSCSGASIMYAVARRYGFRVQTRCIEGFLYIFRGR